MVAGGPAFLDGWYYYGPEMISILASIGDGRPHDMPAFRDKMTTDQIRQLAGYVQTIGAYSAKTAAPSREDDKQTRPSENRAPAAKLFDEGLTPAHGSGGLDHPSGGLILNCDAVSMARLRAAPLALQ